MNKTCIKCGLPQDISEFRKQKQTKDGHANQCRLCLNEIQREKRRENGNATTHKYEKTKNGFLMREYRNMLSRVTGVQKNKAHLYLGLPILDKDLFYEWALGSPEFHTLFEAWKKAGHDIKLCPTVDRIDSYLGYEIPNMMWDTHSENSQRGSLSPKRR